MKSIKKLTLIPALAMVFATAFTGCIKDEPMVTPPQTVYFNATAGSYVVAPDVVYKIPVYLTVPSSDAKPISVTVNSTSATGAVVGTHYTFNNTLTFSANKVIDTITVVGNLPQYDPSGRVDVVTFSFSDPSVVSANLNPTFALTINACKESDLIPTSLNGDYTNTYEDLGGSGFGPYTTKATLTSTGPKTARAVISGIWAPSWAGITFNLDWTDAENRIVTIVPQASGIADATTINPAYAGREVQVRAYAGETSTFSGCDNTFTLRFQIGVVGLGWFTDLYQVDMAR
ncbi:MAG: hypothetical protein EOO09_20445 [Chitinophagaceae bacterium]|nr:MAG: hypothetical protein EOO09_20445 [Chitinophagaceae bacterium]